MSVLVISRNECDKKLCIETLGYMAYILIFFANIVILPSILRCWKRVEFCLVDKLQATCKNISYHGMLCVPFSPCRCISHLRVLSQYANWVMHKSFKHKYALITVMSCWKTASVQFGTWPRYSWLWRYNYLLPLLLFPQYYRSVMWLKQLVYIVQINATVTDEEQIKKQNHLLLTRAWHLAALTVTVCSNRP